MVLDTSALVTVLLARPVRAALIIGAGRSQIGEFSFIIGQSGVALGLIEPTQYSLILAGAMVSITLNPLVLKLVPVFERAVQRYPRLWRELDKYGVQVPPQPEGMTDHVVVMYAGHIFESAPTGELFSNPQNPYTRALLRSVPDPTTEQGELFQIPGLPPDLAHLSKDRCPFADRCPEVIDKCREAFPPYHEVAEDHWTLCWVR